MFRACAETMARLGARPEIFTATVSTNKNIRSKVQQLPETYELRAYAKLLHNFYKDDPFAFERCSMELAKLFLANIHDYEITRPWRDGGRDAIGTYRIGRGDRCN